MQLQQLHQKVRFHRWPETNFRYMPVPAGPACAVQVKDACEAQDGPLPVNRGCRGRDTYVRGSEGCHVCACIETLGRSTAASTTPLTARGQDAARAGSVGPLLSWRCSCKCASSRQSAMQATNYLRRASVTSRVGDGSPQHLGLVFSTSSVQVACNICVDGGQSHYQSCVKLFRLPSFSPPTICLASAGQGIFSEPESEHFTFSPAVIACTRHVGWGVPKYLLPVAYLSRSSHRTRRTIDVCFQKYLLCLGSKPVRIKENIFQ